MTTMPRLEWIRLETLRATTHRPATDRQRAEPVDDALAEVVVEPDRHDERAERHGLGHDARQQPLLVVDAGDVDRPAEHEREEQHEHHRLDGDVGEHLGLALDVGEVAPDQRPDLPGARWPRARRGGWPGSASAVVEVIGPPPCLLVVATASSTSTSARWPVRLRKTSSRLGRCRPMSSRSMPASSSRAAMRVSAPTPSAGAVMCRASRSTWISPTSDAHELGRGRRPRRRRLTVTTRLAAPGLVLELERGALGDDPAVVDDDDVVGELVGLVEVLGGEEQGGAVAHEVAQHVPQLDAAARVEAGGRLVEEEHRRRGDQARGEVEPAPHAAGVVLDHLVAGLGQREPLEQLLGRRASRGGGRGRRGRRSAGGSRGR